MGKKLDKIKKGKQTNNSQNQDDKKKTENHKSSNIVDVTLNYPHSDHGRKDTLEDDNTSETITSNETSGHPAVENSFNINSFNILDIPDGLGAPWFEFPHIYESESKKDKSSEKLIMNKISKEEFSDSKSFESIPYLNEKVKIHEQSSGMKKREKASLPRINDKVKSEDGLDGLSVGSKKVDSNQNRDNDEKKRRSKEEDKTKNNLRSKAHDQIGGNKNTIVVRKQVGGIDRDEKNNGKDQKKVLTKRSNKTNEVNQSIHVWRFNEKDRLEKLQQRTRLAAIRARKKKTLKELEFKEKLQNVTVENETLKQKLEQYENIINKFIEFIHFHVDNHDKQNETDIEKLITDIRDLEKELDVEQNDDIKRLLEWDDKKE